MDEKYITYIMCAVFGEDKKDKIVFSDDVPKLIRECVNKLNDKQKDILDKCAQGMSLSEIAKCYGLSTSTIRWHKLKAIRRLRNPSWCKPLLMFVKRG